MRRHLSNCSSRSSRNTISTSRGLWGRLFANLGSGQGIHLLLVTTRFRNKQSGCSSLAMHLRTTGVTRFEIPMAWHIVVGFFFCWIRLAVNGLDPIINHMELFKGLSYGTSTPLALPQVHYHQFWFAKNNKGLWVEESSVNADCRTV